MYRPAAIPPRRRGVILLVVVVLLTLFAVVGLSFVLYAQAQAEAARLARDAEKQARADVDPELLLSYFLGRLIYDVPDDQDGVFCALRGHSLARNIYGANGGTAPSFSPAAANVVAFNGTGRLNTPSPFGMLVPGPAVNDRQLVNWTFYPDDPQLPPDLRFLRDPERLGWRPAALAAPRGPFTGGLNPPYTYPDLNAVFLAAVRGDGTVLLPSFHRPWAAEVPGSGLPPGAGEFCDRNSGALNPLWSPSAPGLPPWYKYTTLRPLPALNPGFPPPEDGGGDVKNLIGGPGTFRRVGPAGPEHWTNDSFWMDLGFPVLRAPDGRKYKPLFAALVVDLDNRVNVNVHGNLHGPNQGHASNQGWGPWEVNLGRVLTAGGPEWRNLLRGAPAPPRPGRYGVTGTPGALGDLAPAGPAAHFYAQVDFDGGNELLGGPSGPPLLPGLGGPANSCYPSFLTPFGIYAGYGNRFPPERLGHAALANALRPAGDDRKFSPSDLEALLRYGDTGSPALTSELFRLCPAGFSDPRARRLVTTHSFDSDRPGAAPWLREPARFPYEVAPVLDPDRPPTPEGPVIGSPDPVLNRVTPFGFRQDNGDFAGTDWRSLGAALGRINLGRPLPPYPHQGSGQAPPFGPPLTVVGGQVRVDLPFTADAPDGPIWKQFVLAQDARQRLANDIYRRLLVVTGVPPILPDQNPQAPPPDLLRTRRWLAQLAVNLVDYLDEDDISTPFLFYTAEDYRHLPAVPLLPPDPGRTDPTRQMDRPDGEIQWPLYWVFGTELPRVLVNEALAEAHANDPDEAYRDQVRVFVELHQPFPRAVAPTAYQPDAFGVPLRMGVGGAAYTPYRILVGVKSPVPLRATGAAILPGVADANVLGNPDLVAVRASTTDLDFLLPLPTVAGLPQPAWPGAGPYAATPSPYVPPHGPAAGALPQGFLLLGPPELPPPKPGDPPDALLTFDPFDPANNLLIPRATPLLRTPSLQYTRLFPVRQPIDPPDERSEGVAVVLRRLANPYLPFDGRRNGAGFAANFTYNPFVTVDYLEDVPLQAVEAGVQLPVASRGKLQPYAAHRSQLAAQLPGPNANLSYSFGRENLPAPARYDWLTHLDRPPTSPLELLHVSGCQPYQLTQRFIAPNAGGLPVKFGHRAPWLDDGRAAGGPSHRLYRLFEFLETAPQAAGVAAGGRIPGKINLNTVWDPETFRALCDAQPSNSFGDALVDDLFALLLYDGRPNAVNGSLRRTPGPVPGPDDHPFGSLAAGTYPSGDAQVPSGGGAGDTLLRLQPPSGGIHPYLDAELLTKVFNHLTTRSNVFAVWVTVGFFEVTDDTTRPVKLGAEIGRAEGRHVRHRMFAIVDRTNLSIASDVAALVQPVPPTGLPWTVAVTAVAGTTPLALTGPAVPWSIRPGSVLVVDVGANQESVEVLAVNPTNNPPLLTAVFARPHAAGASIALADTPGAPPVFLKPLAVVGPDPLPVPPYVPPPPYPVAVTVAVDAAQSGPAVLAGRYDNVPWKIHPGTRLLLDSGADQEAVTVLPAPFVVDAAAGTGTFQVVVTRPHAADCVLTNTLLGNPGPQPRFDPRAPGFSAVVRHLSVID